MNVLLEWDSFNVRDLLYTYFSFVRDDVPVYWETALVVAVQLLSCVWLFATPWSTACWLPCPSLSPGVSSNSCPLSQWWYLIILSSAAPFSFCCQSFPTSESFPVSWLFISGGQIIGASASAWVLPMNIQGWFPLGLTGSISLLSKGLSRVFSSTTI